MYSLVPIRKYCKFPVLTHSLKTPNHVLKLRQTENTKVEKHTNIGTFIWFFLPQCFQATFRHTERNRFKARSIQMLGDEVPGGEVDPSLSV